MARPLVYSLMQMIPWAYRLSICMMARRHQFRGDHRPNPMSSGPQTVTMSRKRRGNARAKSAATCAKRYVVAITTGRSPPDRVDRHRARVRIQRRARNQRADVRGNLFTETGPTASALGASGYRGAKTSTRAPRVARPRARSSEYDASPPLKGVNSVVATTTWSVKRSSSPRRFEMCPGDRHSQYCDKGFRGDGR